MPPGVPRWLALRGSGIGEMSKLGVTIDGRQVLFDVPERRPSRFCGLPRRRRNCLRCLAAVPNNRGIYAVECGEQQTADYSSAEF